MIGAKAEHCLLWFGVLWFFLMMLCCIKVSWAWKARSLDSRILFPRHQNFLFSSVTYKLNFQKLTLVSLSLVKISFKKQLTAKKPKFKGRLETRCMRYLRRQEPFLPSTASKGAWKKCEGCWKAKVVCIPAGKKVKKASSCDSSLSSPHYEENIVLVEGFKSEYLFLPDMKKFLGNKKNQKNQKVKK